MRRFVGYAVKLPGDRWLAQDHNSCSACPTQKRGERGFWPTGSDAEDDAVDAGFERDAVRLVPTWAVRRPVVVPTQITTEAQVRAFNAMDPSSAKISPPPQAADVDAVERALLERNVAEVSFHVVDLEEDRDRIDSKLHLVESYLDLHDSPTARGSYIEAERSKRAALRRDLAIAHKYVVDCREWLARANAVVP